MSALDTESLPRLSWPASPEELRAYVAASRARQGLPPTVADAAALERVAAVMRVVPDGSTPDAMRLLRNPGPRREVAPRETPDTTKRGPAT